MQKEQNWPYHPIQSLSFRSRKKDLIKTQFLSRAKNTLKDLSGLNCSYNEFLWDVNNFLRRRNDSWYLSLFSETFKRGKISGEITPAYSILPEDIVSEINKLCPNTKIIYLIRNPVERAWSSAITTVPKGKNVTDLPLSHFQWAFNRQASLIRDDYIRSIDIWTKFYGKNQFKVGFFDDIKNNPEKILKEICEFLEVTGDLSVFEASSDRVYQSSKAVKGRSPTIPYECKRYLYEKNYETLVELHRRYGSYASLWLEEAREFVT